MLANSWQIFKPWATVATGTVIFPAVLGFSLIGEGLRRQLSMAELGRRTPLSNVSRLVGAWVDDLLLVPGVAASRQQHAAGIVTALLVTAGRAGALAAVAAAAICERGGGGTGCRDDSRRELVGSRTTGSLRHARQPRYRGARGRGSLDSA